MRLRIAIVLLLLLILALSACVGTRRPTPWPTRPPTATPAPEEVAAKAVQPKEVGSDAQEDGSEVSEPESEAAASADTGPLPIAECLASPDMYTWSHTMTSKDEGSRGWTCQGKLKITNVSKEPLLLDPHLDVSNGTNSPDPWIPGTETEGDQYHEWQLQRVLAPKETYEYDTNFTAYDNGTYTYRQITRIVLRRKLTGCFWFTPLNVEDAATSPAESSVEIPNPCLDGE